MLHYRKGKYLGVVDQHNIDLESIRRRLESLYCDLSRPMLTLSALGIIEACNDFARSSFWFENNELIGRSFLELLEPSALKDQVWNNVSAVDAFLRDTAEVKLKTSPIEWKRFHLSFHKLESAASWFWLLSLQEHESIKLPEQEILDSYVELANDNGSLKQMMQARTIELESTVEELGHTVLKLNQQMREREEVAVSLQKRESQLERLLSRERELGELRSRFVSMASHEFRTPLTTMLLSTEIIEMAQPEADELVAKHIGRIRENIGYLRNVLEDFLNIGKMDQTGPDLMIQPINLDRMIPQLCEELRHLCKPGQEVAIEMDEAIGATEHSSSGLRIVITNLVTNAIKYSESGALIEVKVWRKPATDTEPEMLVIEVKDEGIGIPEHDLCFIFERFFRASNVDNIKGTGLGLHISARYTKAMSGTITARNDPRQNGCIFRFETPYFLKKGQHTVS